MNHSKLIRNYKGAATYQITVVGKIDPNFMSRINNLSISHTETNNRVLSIVTGDFADQEALNGLLNILFDHQYPVISLMKIDG